jgi:hypothetical protein
MTKAFAPHVPRRREANGAPPRGVSRLGVSLRTAYRRTAVPRTTDDARVGIRGDGRFAANHLARIDGRGRASRSRPCIPLKSTPVAVRSRSRDPARPCQCDARATLRSLRRPADRREWNLFSNVWNRDLAEWWRRVKKDAESSAAEPGLHEVGGELRKKWSDRIGMGGQVRRNTHEGSDAIRERATTCFGGRATACTSARPHRHERRRRTTCRRSR